MANLVKLKRSAVAGKAPVVGDLALGELALNTRDGKLYAKTSDGTSEAVVQLSVDSTVVKTTDTGTVTSTMLLDGTILNADVNATAAIAGTKISPDFGSQNVTTTGTSNAASFIPTSSTAPSNGLYLSGTNAVALATASTGRLFVDASGSIGVGSTPAFAVGSGVEIERDSATATLRLQRVNTGGSILEFRADNSCAVIDSRVTSTDLLFQTNAAERMRLTSDGYVRLSSSSSGIQFGGDTAAANALDDYEEGTFTPTVTGSSTAGTGTYNSNGQVGRYTKIGNRVSFTIYVDWSAHTGTGSLRVSGLPFTSNSATNAFNAVALYAGALTYTGPMLQAYFGAGSTTIIIGQMTAAGVASGVPMDTAANLTLTGHYEV